MHAYNFSSSENNEPKTTHNDSFWHDLSCYSIFSLAADILNFQNCKVAIYEYGV